MTILDILKRALNLYKKNFKLLVGIVLPGWFLILFLGTLLGKVAFVNISNITEQSQSIGAIFKVALVSISMFWLIFFILFFITSAGTIGILKRMLGQKVKAGYTYKLVLKRIFPLVGSILLATVIIGTTFLIPIIGIIIGFFFYIRYNFVPQVVILEAEGGVGSLKRSKSIINEYLKKTAILMAPPLILQAAVMTLIYRAFEIAGLSNWTMMLIALFSIIIIGTLIEPFKILISTLLYYDLRVIKEGYDLKMMEKEIDNLSS